ncbi:MAG TPA: TIGR03435 family protein [Bryobacteraceae bacterium]
MRDHELLALGVFGRACRLEDRIKTILTHRRAFSPRASLVHLTASAAGLLALAAGASFTPRWIAFAQRLEFEVASIKPVDHPAGGTSADARNGQFRGTADLRGLIEFAYGVRLHQLSGGPGWMATAGFYIDAKPDPAKPIPRGFAPVREMMRSLLEDRFKLAVHWETKKQPIYELVPARSGSKMKQADKPGDITFAPGRLTSSGATTLALAMMLEGPTGRMVIDKTGLAGLYAFSLEWTPDDAPADLATGASLFTAIQEQLGLRLQSATGPVETLVIDHAEKPSEN